MDLERGFPQLTAAEWATLLRHVRHHMHCSQFEAAELLNVGASTYKKWEEGKRVPHPYHRRRIRDILSGEIQISHNTSPVNLKAGQFCLVPACLADVVAQAQAGSTLLSVEGR